ncbi:MAG: hypothetical protein AB3N16_02440 [Flavobacteriaceae bacterium]
MNTPSILISLLFFFGAPYAFAQTNYLENSLKLYGGNQNGTYLEMWYEGTNNYLSHSMRPNEIGTRTHKGTLSLNGKIFQKVDTVFTQSGKTYLSKTRYSKGELYTIPYGRKDIREISRTELNNYLIKTLPYTPLLVLQHFYEQQASDLSIKKTDVSISYGGQIEDYYVTLNINKENYQVDSISTFSDIEEDDQFYGYGDVTDVFLYKKNRKSGLGLTPTLIIKRELNGQLIDTINIGKIGVLDELTQIIIPPDTYTIKEKVPTQPDVSVDQYSENIHLINLHHCGTRSLLVEFEDFLLVAESPLNSTYGEQLLAEVKKINSTKPIKYFTFGHFHPHYTGGIRPFIHQGAKIICLEQNNEYIQSIANAKFTLKPDSLEISPKEVQFENLYQAKTITDGSFYMTLYHIGKKSNHTDDYLIYYFPKEKMIFEDDLVWIDEDTNKSNISELTSGFYQAVKDLNLQVDEVVQNWHVFNKEENMIFKFETLKKIFEDQ